MRRQTGFTLIELLVVIAVVAMLVALLLPAVQQVREAARAAECKDRLHQIGVALHNYETTYQRLPPGFVCAQSFYGASQKNQFGWGAMLLPQLEQKPLADRFNYNQMVWDDTGDVSAAIESNQDAAETPLAVFRCPSDVAPETVDRTCGITSGPVLATSNYAAVEGITRMVLPCLDPVAIHTPAFYHPLPPPCDPPEGAFYMNSSKRIEGIPDGSSHTFAVGETSHVLNRQRCVCCPDSPVGGTVWAGVSQLFRSDHVLSITSEELNDENGDGISLGFSSMHPGGAQFLLFDGQVRLISDSIDRKSQPPWGVYQWLSTIAGSETVNGY
jgi:prepilin-type N-terminal cleavage/methylation domain-containing protein